jgi:hypothetical protein
MPRQTVVGKDVSVGVWKLLGEGEGSFGSRGLGRAVSRRAVGS